jgi:hypothetical protein
MRELGHVTLIWHQTGTSPRAAAGQPAPTITDAAWRPGPATRSGLDAHARAARRLCAGRTTTAGAPSARRGDPDQNGQKIGTTKTETTKKTAITALPSFQ